jgi:hypothetical protein
MTMSFVPPTHSTGPAGVDPSDAGSVDPIAGTSPSDPASNDPSSLLLTGDGILELYDLRMSYIDARVGEVATSMQQATQDADALNTVDAVLAKYASGVNGADQWNELNNAFVQAETSLPADDPLRAKLEQLRTSKSMLEDGNGNVGPSTGQNPLTGSNDAPTPADFTLSTDEVTNLTKSIEGLQKDVDTDNQKGSMELSVFMGWQNEASSLFSQIVESNHQATMSIVNNMK